MRLVRTVAIVGSNGFIGKNLCKYLLGHRYEIRQFHSRSPFDLKDSLLLQELESIDVIVWAASKVNPTIAEKSPQLVFEEYQSWVETLRLLKSANWNGRLIFLSSGGCVYDSGISPYKETDSAKGTNAYGRLKSHMESQLQISGLKYTIFRVSNVYGPFQRYGRGQGVLAEWLNCFNNNVPLLVFGNESNYRDYIHVLDVCKGIHSIFDIHGTDTYNLGSGKGTTIGTLLKVFKQGAGQDIDVIYHSNRDTDRNGFYLDLEKLKKTTNWTPTVDIEVGVSSLFETLKERYDPKT
jgi:UDP-glucose 4-epimerase